MREERHEENRAAHPSEFAAALAPEPQIRRGSQPTVAAHRDDHRRRGGRTPPPAAPRR